MAKQQSYGPDKIIFILIFLFALYTPLLSGIFHEDKTTSVAEKRSLATLPLPPTSLQELNEYPNRYNTYYSDHFGYREELTKIYFSLINSFSSKASVNDVTAGKAGWLFLGSIKPGYQEYGDPIGDAMNANLFTEHQLEVFAQSIVTTKNWLADQGIKYVYVIAPNKHTIYFENLPEYIKKKNKESSTDQLVTYLNKNTDINVIDLRKALLKAKEKHQVYFKTDTHWNQYGANAAQFEIMKRIQGLFPAQIAPFTLDDSQFEILSKAGGDLAQFAKMENVTEDNPSPIFNTGCTPINKTLGYKKREAHTTECTTQQLNAVIFGDSFHLALKPYLSRQFNRATYLRESINYSSLIKYIKQENPDIIIEEVAERVLPYTPSGSLLKNITPVNIQRPRPSKTR